MDNAEFVIRDRPRVVETDPSGNEFAYYLVHVGDSPTLAFRSKFRFCDYAVMHNTRQDTFEDCGPDLPGAFEWPYRFATVTPPGEFTRLEVTGYRIAGQRDFMPYNGKKMELELGNDPADGIAATAGVNVRVYQSRLTVPVDMGGKAPLWRASRLLLEGKGIRKRRIRHSESPRPGYFTVEPAPGSGRFMVVYEPSIDEIDPARGTTALLQVPDEDGHFHDFRAEVLPPTADDVRETTPAPTGGAAMPSMESPS